MQTIATNIRFSQDEYEELRQLAFLSRKSIASLVREAINCYKQKVVSTVDARKALFSAIVKSAVKIDTSVVDLAREGRKFE